MEERIRARIAEIEAEREQFVAQANQQIAAFNGAIQALRGLLEPDPRSGGPGTEEADAPH